MFSFKIMHLKKTSAHWSSDEKGKEVMLTLDLNLKWQIIKKYEADFFVYHFFLNLRS